MKARKIKKIYLHYLKSNVIEKGKYHFILDEDEMLVNLIPIFSNSTIDNDNSALHFACINKTDIPERIVELAAILGYLKPEFIEVFEEEKLEEEQEVKPKRKKK